jgi:pyridoxamine 5'-phosphate oxidase
MTTGKKLFELRKEYTRGGLSLKQVLPDPFAQFHLWFDQAIFAEIVEPNIMSLATASVDGKVSSRILLLKEVDDKGFVFYTNYNSNKAKQLQQNPWGSMLFLWLLLERQVRIEGKLHKVTDEESDEYFGSRPRESQLGSWASEQSTPIGSREELVNRYTELEKHYSGKDIPRPPHWGGYRLVPEEVEFWQGRPGRLHDRILYYKNNDTWEKKRLAP